MEFAYQARDNAGGLRTGVVEANDQLNAFDILQDHGLIVVKLTPVQQISFLERVVLFDRVSFKDLVMFTRQLATLISSKVPIISALKIMQTQVSSHKFKEIIGGIADKVESGDSLSSAMTSYPKTFPTLYLNLVHSGELSGSLEDSLNYLANQLEKDYDLRSKLLVSLIYPAFIVFAVIVVGIMMFVWVLPPLIAVLGESSVELPTATKILVAATNFAQSFWWIILMLLVGGFVGLSFYSQTVNGRYLVDYCKLRIPIFGKLYKNIYMARYARNLATLIGGGIPIVKALDSVADIVGNKIYRDILLEASQQVRNGKTIASTLSKSREIPPLVIQMTQIGESTGKLQDIMAKMAVFYEKEVDVLLQVITTLIEPAIMIVLGIAVAIMVAGILLPIYNLASVA